ncbi:MAG: metallophosphoesterase [Fibrobacteres bacterium]|nr:metallophosphoesterase [Fibrobacterota bacterium]
MSASKPPSKAPRHVASNATEQFGIGIPGFILYPALGAPGFVSPKETLHLLLLAPSTLRPPEVNRRLKVFGDFAQLVSLKRKGNLGTPIPQKLCPDDTGITLRTIEDPESLIEIPELGFRGYLQEKVIERLKLAEVESRKPFQKLFLASIDLAKADESLQAVIQFTRFFLHWADFGDVSRQYLEKSGIADGKRQESQEYTLQHSLIHTANDKGTFFLGKRLVADLQAGDPSSLSLACLNPDGLSVDHNTLVTDIHPVYRKRPKHGASEALNLGVISDLHLVTKFQVLKHSPIRNMPIPKTTDVALWKALDSLFPKVGPMISDTVKVLSGHFDAMRTDTETDGVLLLGDLIDFHRDNYPTDRSYLRSQKDQPDQVKAKAIWKSMTIPNIVRLGDAAKTLEPNYQYGTSYLGMFHLVSNFVTRGNKPIFLANGNHDGYQEPFGISPRASFDGEPASAEVMKMNEGIPCDSNLTIREATLAFGDSYPNFVRATDFDATVIQMFNFLFNPFRTWSLDTGTKQRLVLFQWADDEAMLVNAQDDATKLRVGHLPHAPQMIGDKDLALLQSAILSKGERRLVVGSHFTFACYDPHIPIHEDEQVKNRQKFSSSDVKTLFGGTNQFLTGLTGLGRSDRPNDANYGTFHLNRKQVFRWIGLGAEQGISATISGHAHRAAFYTHTNLQGGVVPDQIEVTGWHLEDFRKYTATLRDECLMVVSDSAGPIPRRNEGGILKGWGSQAPSWTRLRFDSQGAVISLESMLSKFPKARPRIGVSLDYLESTVGAMLRLASRTTFKKVIGGYVDGVVAKLPKFIKPKPKPKVVKALEDSNNDPLWKHDPAQVFDDSRSGAYLFKAGSELSSKTTLFATEILGSWVGEGFAANGRRFSELLFHQVVPLGLFPAGLSISSCNLVFKVSSREWFNLLLTPKTVPPGSPLSGTPLWHVQVNKSELQRWSAFCKRVAQGGVPYFADSWVSVHFLSSYIRLSESYDVATPWTFQCRFGVDILPDHEIRPFFHRDIWANERPDFSKY